MREDEREPAAATPLEAGVTIERAEPASGITTGRGQEERMATGILDRIVHDDDPPQTHGLDVGIREHVADETANLGVGLHELTTRRLDANLVGDATVVGKDLALEDTDLGGDTGGRLEVLRAKNAFCVVAHAITLALETLNPFLAGRAVGHNRKGDDSTFLTPQARRFGNCGHLAQEPLHPLDTTELVEHGFNLSRGHQAIVLHQSLH